MEKVRPLVWQPVELRTAKEQNRTEHIWLAERVTQSAVSVPLSVRFHSVFLTIDPELLHGYGSWP